MFAFCWFSNVYPIANDNKRLLSTNRASADWKSTYAVKHLKQVVSYARGKDDAPVYVKPKTGTQKKNGYKNIAILYYEFVHHQIDYLNFTVKLTIGVKSNGNHIQYCVNKIEV